MTKDLLEKIEEGFNFKPKIIGEKPIGFSRIITGGMGGSHLAASFLTSIFSNLLVHSDYGLPFLPEVDLKNSLFVAISHSGETEETLDFALKAHNEGYKLAIISGGGKLLDFAKEKNLPYIQTPIDLPARMSVGFQMNAILTVIGEKKPELEPVLTEEAVVQELVDFVGGFIPIIYASGKNISLANYLKVLLNESSKIPAFANSFPEMNHNELNSFHQSGKIKNFRFILLKDQNDYPKIRQRMEIFKKLFLEAGASLYELNVLDKDYQKVLNFSLLANQISLEIAKKRGVDPNEILLIEKFKVEMK